MSIDLFDDIVDDASVTEMRVGQVGTCKGQLEAVRFGDRWKGPSLVMKFADWGMLNILLMDEAAARSIRFPINTYLCVKVQCINEDAEVMAIALWEMGSNSVPIPVGELM